MLGQCFQFNNTPRDWAFFDDRLLHCTNKGLDMLGRCFQFRVVKAGVSCFVNRFEPLYQLIVNMLFVC
uniref:Uncharacterized protein n=1 Tax=Meloidogyne incognita TaxID=6306 RepID=A0A914LZ63_MELIC